MKRTIGYGVALLGLIVIVLGVFGGSIPFLEGVGELVLYGVGGVLLIVGVLLTFMDSKSSKAEHASEEVPIYQGKKIVGYRRSD